VPKKKKRRGKSRKTTARVRAKLPLLHPFPAPAPALRLPLLPRRPHVAACPSSGFRFRFRISPHRPLCPSLSEVRMLDDG